MEKTLVNLDVQSVADTIIFAADELGEYITNMDLQRILYLMKIDHYKESNNMLFSNPLQAWDHGPVVDDVWKKYRHLGRTPINSVDEYGKDYNRAIFQDVSRYVDEYLNMSESKKYNMIHSPLSPYSKSRKDKSGHITEKYMI